MKILGGQFGVEIVPRGRDDDHACIQILSEDDDNWFESGSSFSSFWLDDLIKVLQSAKTELQTNYEKEEFGYKFKKRRTGMKEYIVMTNSEDGNMFMQVLTEDQLLKRLNSNEYGDEKIFSLADIKEECKRLGWDFAGEGPRGMIIFEARGITVPSPKKSGKGMGDIK